MLFHSKLKSILDKALCEVGKTRKTNDVKYHCPKCKHVKQKLEVNIDSGEFHCWVCHFRGSNVIDLLKECSSGKSYIEECKSVLKEAGKQIKDWDKVLKPIDESEIKTLSLPEDFVELSNGNRDKNWKTCFDYASSRGFSAIDMMKHNMGYVKSGNLYNRLIIPSYDLNGTLNYYSARSYTDKVYLKYINANVSAHNIVGFELLIDFKQPINLVEGALDAITLGHNTIPLYGKNVSRLLKKRIIENKTPEIRVILDDDALKESISICENFINMGKTVKLVRLNGKDSNQIGRSKSQEIVENTKILDFSDLIKLKIG